MPTGSWARHPGLAFALGLVSATASVSAFTSTGWGSLVALTMFVPLLVHIRLNPHSITAIVTYALTFSFAMFYGTQH